MSDTDGHEELLEALRAHGERFLTGFSLPQSTASKLKSPYSTSPSLGTGLRERNFQKDVDLYGDEEWEGCHCSSAEESQGEDDDTEDGFEHDGDEMRAESFDQPTIVIFSEQPGKSVSKNTNVPMKTFMSSKVSKIQLDGSTVQNVGGNEAEEDEERTNAQNDALLHRLVHTKLLSGSLDTESEMRPSQRRKALAGRILEAAGDVKLGKGEYAVRANERNKASRRVRQGLVDKKKQREKEQLEEAKNLGNYHPSLKRKLDLSLESTRSNPKRERGLKMGVGKFNGGMLKLSKQDISAVQGFERGRERPRIKGAYNGRGSSRKRTN